MKASKLALALGHDLTGLESVNINSRLDVHVAFTALIESVRGAGALAAIKKRIPELGKFVKDNFGINAKVKMEATRMPNAYVQFSNQDVMAQSPLTHWPEAYQNLKGDKRGDLKKLKKFEGAIDLDNAKLKGDLTKLKFKMGVTEGLLMNPIYSSGEISAIILHECGHVFSLLARFNDVCRTNYAIATATHAIYDIESREQRVSAIKAFKRNRLLHTLDEDPDITKDVALKRNLGNYLSVVVSSDTTDTYSKRSWEFSSDQFAARMGAGRDLYTALDKIMRDGGADDLTETGKAIRAAIINAIMSALLTPLMGALAPVLFVLAIIQIYNSDQKIYDDPAERLERIIHSNTALLRDSRITKDTRDRILGDNTLLRREALEYKVRATQPELIKRFLMGGYKAHKDKLVQQQLEELINGESVEIAARAQQIADLA